MDVMTDQAEALRRLVLETAPASAEQQGTLLLVHGGYRSAAAGRLGLQLALAFHRRTGAAALVEIARELATCYPSTSANVRPTLRDVTGRRRTLREAWQMGPCGLPTVAGELSDRSAAALRSLTDQLKVAARRQRVVVHVEQFHDLSGLLTVSDHCVFVATAEAERLSSVYQTIKSAAALLGGARCWSVFTQASDPRVARELQQRLASTCDRCLNLAIHPLAVLPPDPLLLPDDSPQTATGAAVVSESMRTELDRMVESIEASGSSSVRRPQPRALERPARIGA
jgi:hypothetical protein